MHKLVWQRNINLTIYKICQLSNFMDYNRFLRDHRGTVENCWIVYIVIINLNGVTIYLWFTPFCNRFWQKCIWFDIGRFLLKFFFFQFDKDHYLFDNQCHLFYGDCQKNSDSCETERKNVNNKCPMSKANAFLSKTIAKRT